MIYLITLYQLPLPTLLGTTTEQVSLRAILCAPEVAISNIAGGTGYSD
jgi:hypothetical protein